MPVTLTVDEILADFMPAFRIQNPEIFGPEGFATDFRSDTARVGDTVTASVEKVPVTTQYDANNGGFKANAQAVTSLMEDVSVTLNIFRCCTVKIPYLTGLATKGVDLYKAAIANQASALGKYLLDGILGAALTNVSNTFQTSLGLTSVDSFEALRSQCNSQKMEENSRFCFVNTPLASALGSDDRTKSKIFYNQPQGAEVEAYRTWRNMAGFKTIREYTDFPGGGANFGGLACDRRLTCVSVRRLRSTDEIPDALGLPKVMSFKNVSDKETGLELAGIAWQQAGVGDLYLSVAILAGLYVGNGGGAPGSSLDNAGCLIQTI